MQISFVRAATLVVTALITTACGGGSDSPTSPSPTSSSSARTISVSGNLAFGDVAVGTQRDLSMSITNSGNSSLTVTSLGIVGFGSQISASWTSGTIGAGATQPVTVRFTPTAAGSYSGTLTVRGDQTSGTDSLPMSGTASAGGFAGTWAGTYVVEACDGTGSVQDLFCSANRGLFPPGTTLPISMTLNQTGSTVSGTVAFGQVSGPVTGTVNGAGALSLQGTVASGTVSATIASWSTTVQNGQMVGAITYNFAERTLPGTVAVRTRLTGVTRR
jgi:hypothetical protein